MPFDRLTRLRARQRRRRAAVCLVPIALVATLALIFPIMRGDAADPLDLGTADPFALLAGSAITNTGSSVINGNVGSYPTDAISGFPPGIINGTNHGNDTVSQQAQDDFTTAYNAAASNTATTIPTELAGSVLTPGTYDSTAGTFGITGTVTLDGQSNPDAVFIFKAATTLDTAAGAAVTLTNGASACNVYWLVGTTATFGAGTQLKGTVLAQASISSGDGAVFEGRLLAKAAITLTGATTVTVPTCTPPPPPTTAAPPPTTSPPPPTPTAPPPPTAPPTPTPTAPPPTMAPSPFTTPGAPTSVVATSNANTQSVVSWTAPAWDGGSTITDYQVSVYNSDGSEATGVTGGTTRNVGSGVTTYNFTGLTNSTGYTFKVSAINATGTGVQSSASAVATPNPVARSSELAQTGAGYQGGLLALNMVGLGLLLIFAAAKGRRRAGRGLGQ